MTVPNDVLANTILTPISGTLVSDEMTTPETLPVVPEKRELDSIRNDENKRSFDLNDRNIYRRVLRATIIVSATHTCINSLNSVCFFGLIDYIQII